MSILKKGIRQKVADFTGYLMRGNTAKYYVLVLREQGVASSILVIPTSKFRHLQFVL